MPGRGVPEPDAVARGRTPETAKPTDCTSSGAGPHPMSPLNAGEVCWLALHPARRASAHDRWRCILRTICPRL